MTTRLTGGLNRGYKPRLQASASRRWLSLCSSLIAFDSSLASFRGICITSHHPLREPHTLLHLIYRLLYHVFLVYTFLW